jgi:hypothetical protein
MSVTPLSFGSFVDTTDSEQRWQIYNAVVAGGSGGGSVTITGSLPAGTNSIGSVGLNTGANTIGNVNLNAGTNKIGTFDQATSTTPFNVKDHNAAASGSTFFNDTANRTGTWYCIQVLASCVFTTIIDSTRSGNTFNGVTIPAGTIFFGNITSITLASGSIIAYNA